jgi:hypothetical protein
VHIIVFCSTTTVLHVLWHAVGPCFTSKAVVYPTLVALQVMRDDNARAAVTSKHSYCLQVAPQTDCALMIAAAMAIEDIFHPK